MHLRVELVAGQLIDLIAGESPRLGLTQSLGQAEQRLVVLRLIGVARAQIMLVIRRQREHGPIQRMSIGLYNGQRELRSVERTGN